MSMLKTAGFVLAFCTAAVGAEPKPTGEEQAAARFAEFTRFAAKLEGEWRCEIREWDGKSETPVWSDTQKRIFAPRMAKRVLEERAILVNREGKEYEAGIHLTTFDSRRDRFVQHGFWLPTQADRLFVVEGRLRGDEVDATLVIRTEAGGEDSRPYRLRWRGPDRWEIEVDGRRDDGSVFLREKVVYTRVR
jgi:hypothetical protein